MPQLARIAIHIGEFLYFRCPYQAKVMKMLEIVRRIAVVMRALSVGARRLPHRTSSFGLLTATVAVAREWGRNCHGTSIHAILQPLHARVLGAMVAAEDILARL